METDSPVVYHGTSESRFPKNEPQKIIPEFSAQEKEVLKICRKESLYYRCLPLAVAGIAATQFAVRKGFLTPHPVWGSGLQMAGAAFVGWVVGKISYRTKCEDRFLQLENSTIGDSIRRRRGYVIDRHESGFVRSAPVEEGRGARSPSSSADSFSYYPDTDYRSSSGSRNVDDDKIVQYSGFDDRERPFTDREVMQETEPVRRSTTYEDLRRRNREEHERLQRQPGSRVNQTTQPYSQRPWGNLDNNSPPRRYKDPNEGDSINAYGDSWDNAKFS